MDRQRIKEMIPLIMVACATIYTSVVVLTTDVMLSYKHRIAITITALAIVSYFFNRKLSSIILGIGLVLGLVNLISFTPGDITIGGGIKINSLGGSLSLQLFSLIVTFAFLFAHGKAIKEWINKDGV